MVPKECRGLRLRVTFIHRTPALSADLWPCVIPKSLEQIILTETPPSSASKEWCILLYEEWSFLFKTSEHILLLYLSLSSMFFSCYISLPNSFITLCYHILLFYLPRSLFPHSSAFVNVPSSLHPPILLTWSQMHAGNYLHVCKRVRVAYLRSVHVCLAW